MMAAPKGLLQCEDFLQFEAALKQMRTLDDKIIYALNNSLPTASFKGQIDATAKCKELHDDIERTFSERRNAIKKCIEVTSAKVQELKNSADPSELRPAQLRLRLFRNEVYVEAVIQDRTRKVYYERCRDYYLPQK